MDRGRRIEFALLYVAAPLAMALAMPPDWLWPVFFAVTLAALGLLALTPGFAWGELVGGGVDGGRGGGIDWGEVGLVALATAAAAGVLVWLLVPGQAFALPRRAPGLWLAILLVYPVLSALPQEIVFRALFFRRYGRLFPGAAGLAVNALAFGLAHLMFWNWVAAALSVAGGAIFARGYLRRGFLQAVLLHAVAGGVIFTSGLGVFFYHGAVGR